MKMFVLAILLLLLNAVQYSSCERFNIVPSPDSPCPGEFTGEPCLTLDQYVSNPSLSSNIIFELHAGNHRLDSQLRLSSINSFMMLANTSATITCNQQFSQPFYFNGLQQVHISDIIFAGCRMELNSITNATFERNSFMDRTRCCATGAALYTSSSSVLIRQCIISNNRVYSGAIYGHRTTFIIDQTTFRNNYYPYYGCCSNTHGSAIYTNGGNMNILNCNFSGNSVSSHGGNGGAIYFDGNNITVINSTFINNRASAGGGGAIYSARRSTNISLINNFFSHNTASYCGVVEIAEFYHYHINITGNTFIYNRAVQQISGNSGGGVICVRNASVLILDNNFSHNSAAGDGGVIQADESEIAIERSIFRNNRAGGNGGVLHTYFYPTTYSIIDSFFINNRAGGDGGAMYVGRAGSHVITSQGIFGFNMARNRGGVIAIIGSTLEMNRASIFGNTAELGEVVSACNSNVTVFNLDLLASQDPTYSFCSLYNQSTTSDNYTFAEIEDDITMSTPASQVDIINIIPSTSSSCPSEFTGEPCFTLEQYAAYPPSHQSSNITFSFHPGTHHLNSRFSLSNIQSFTLQANTAATVTISCREEIYGSFDFYQLQQIHISDITFIGCSVNLRSIVNATFVRNTFINRTTNGIALYSYNSSVQIKQCTMSNNSNGAIYFSGYNSRSLTIDRSLFSNNSYSYSYYYPGYYYSGYYYYGGEAIGIHGYTSYYNGMVVYPNGRTTILNSIFEYNNGISFSYDGQSISILNSTFKSNDGISFYYGEYNVNISNSTFKDNRARRGDHGGAINFNGGNITVFNSNFINNTASGRGGGAIYFASSRHNTIMLLTNNTFSHNTAAYCGVIKMTAFHYHHYISITGNIFTYNRAIDQVPGINGGGVICARNASVLVVDNIFSHSSAAGDGGVIQADESDVTIERSIFSNNTAGGNGGALQTYLYPSNYTVMNSSFTYNRAGGDGGVMYIGRTGSHVIIYGSTFSNNYAAERGGVIAVVGSTLQLNQASVYENFARTGEVINSCNSNVTIINPIVLATQEPVVFLLCAPYDDSNTTVSPITVQIQITPVPITEPLTQESTTTEDLVDIITTDDTTKEDIAMTTTPHPQPNDTTELADVTVTTVTLPQPEDTTEDSITMATTTLPQSIDITSKAAIEDTPRTTESDASTNAVIVMTTTSQIENQDNQGDTAQHNLHTLVPGYVAIGAFIVLLVLFVLFGVVIIVKMFRVKPLEPQKVNHLNFSTREYPLTMKNEYTLPEVHLVST